MWSRPDVFRLLSNSVGSFSSNVLLTASLFSINLVPKCAGFSALHVTLNAELQLKRRGNEFGHHVTRKSRNMLRFMDYCITYELVAFFQPLRANVNIS